MEHSVHQTKIAPLRWSVITKIVLVICAVACVAFATWYVFAFALPSYRQTQREAALDSVELQILAGQVVQIGKFVHPYR